MKSRSLQWPTRLYFLSPCLLHDLILYYTPTWFFHSDLAKSAVFQNCQAIIHWVKAFIFGFPECFSMEPLELWLYSELCNDLISKAFLTHYTENSFPLTLSTVILTLLYSSPWHWIVLDVYMSVADSDSNVRSMRLGTLVTWFSFHIQNSVYHVRGFQQIFVELNLCPGPSPTALWWTQIISLIQRDLSLCLRFSVVFN